MRILSVFFVVAVLTTGLVNGAISQPSLGEPFDLAVGQSKMVGDQGLEVGFVGIVGDSRCPLGVICIWEGDAAAHIWADRPFRQRGDFELHTNPQFKRHASYERYRISLLEVAPYPKYGTEIDPADYHVTVVVTTDEATVEVTTWGKIKGLYSAE